MKGNRLFGPLVLAALSSTFLAVASGVSAQAGSTPTDPVAQVDARKANFKTLGRAMNTIDEFVKGEGGTAADAQAAAATLAETGRHIGDWWPEGTAIGVGDSEARPEIWTNKAEFLALQERFKATLPGMVQAAATGDRARMGEALKAVGRECGACHDSYKLD
jgi:cytochrome c556